MQQTNKLTLVIDGNWLMFSRYFMIRDEFLIDNTDAVKEAASEKLSEIMAQSISVLLRRFNNIIDNVILVTDGKSWRKSIPQPTSREDVDYKGNRSKPSDIDMHYVFESLRILGDNLRNQNITVCHAEGAEGDDWCWHWSRKLNKENINVILWTTDEDIKQLVQIDPNTATFTAWYNDSKGVVVHDNVEKGQCSDVDFFMVQEFMNRCYYDVKHQIKKVSTCNPRDIICRKIFCGDNGDNIKPIFRETRGSKVFKATEKTYGKINLYKSFWETAWDLVTERVTEDLNQITLFDIYNNIFQVKKITGTTIGAKAFEEEFNYNRSLVWLDKSQIPQDVQDAMNEQEYLVCDSDLMRNITMNYRYMINRSTKKISELFDETPF